MKKIVSLYLSLFLIPFSLQAQISQKGLVTELNSGKKPVAGVQLIFFGAPPADSDNDGDFILVFKSKEPGDVSFSTEIYKKGYEIVNKKELTSIIISSNPTFPVKVVMAKKGTLAKMRVEYYKISKNALTINYRKKIKELEDKNEQQIINKKQHDNEKELLRESYETQLKNLNKLVDRFVRTNFDDASDLYKKSFEYFTKGHIDSAVFVLEDADLYQRGCDRIKERERINSIMEELQQRKVDNFIGILEDIKAIKFQSNIYSLKQQYSKKGTLMNAYVVLDSLNNQKFNEIINFWQEKKQYNKIIQLYKLLQYKSEDSGIKANIDAIIGDVYLMDSKPDSASFAYVNFYNHYHKNHIDNNNDIQILENLVLISTKLASLYQTQKTFTGAIKFGSLCVDYSKEFYILDEENIEYYTSYGIALMNLGAIYFDAGDNKQAKENYKSALKIMKKSFKQTEDEKYSSLKEEITVKLKALK